MVSTQKKLDLPKDAAQGKRFAVVVSRYHEEISGELLKGALWRLESLGADAATISTVWVPGSFEIPLAAHALAQHQQVDAILCLGVIVRGETSHYDYIARETARGIAMVGHQFGLPVVFGVLTTENVEQAKARSGGNKGHKGIEAAETAVEMVQTLERLKKKPNTQSKNVGFGN